MAIAGNWALQWTALLSLAWLVSAIIVIRTILNGIASWAGIIYAIALIGGAIAIWRSGDDGIKSVIRKSTTIWNRSSSDLRKSFSGKHSFLILAGANLFGIALGRFLYGFLR